ncbi:hypothetical protein UFOVP1287_24 [uncultured Caudovirales phage]|uniref:Uncharacterized protein n=1 Tax=uncultured Caudovirales phage TaxID=2100421 RepID=A0A6J5S831_9CAUD|nr:hypothetical protein UFOVP1287_24 [uncultured Caudovirales phage]CAB4205074.1 hypothetical protein UFOVP1408_16 [uncultured Caudovirales phage]
MKKSPGKRKVEAVYLVLRRSPELNYRWTEVKGVYSSREAAQASLSGLVATEGRTSKVEKYWVFPDYDE